jgi:hypothetical protein
VTDRILRSSARLYGVAQLVGGNGWYLVNLAPSGCVAKWSQLSGLAATNETDQNHDYSLRRDGTQRDSMCAR